MQLHFLPAEFDLLADILLNQSSPDRLINQVLERHLHLDCDEIDQLREILANHLRKLMEQAGHCEDPLMVKKLQGQQKLLGSMMDKVSEAAAVL